MKMRPLKDSDTKSRVEPALDQGQIVQAALSLLDEMGFDGLTMRSLANRLGIKAASLYWHVRDKHDLLGLLSEEICAPMREPDRTLSWRSQLDMLANEYRRVLLAHRDAARVLASSGGPSGPKRARLSEMLLRTLLDAGFAHKDAAYAGLLLNDYVVMDVLEETQFAYSSAEMHNWMDVLSLKDYPSMAVLAGYLNTPDLDERFHFGIEILCSGLEAFLARRKS